VKKTNYLALFFDLISETIAGAERSFLDLLSALVPYCVPVIPAYLTYYHTINEMQFPSWVAWTAAFVTESLGLASVATAIKFWKHNQRYKNGANRAPFWLAVGTYVFYLVIVLSVNVLLEEVTGKRSPAVIWSIGLFCLLSFPAAVLISIRAQHTEILAEVEERKEERRQAKDNERQSRAPASLRPAYNSDTKGEKLQEGMSDTETKFRK